MNDQADGPDTRRTAESAAELELVGYVLDLSERERAALARTLHDEFGSNLTAINLDIASVAAQLPEGVARKRLERAMSVLKETVELKRRLIQTLRPGMIDTLGLVPTLRIEAEGFQTRTGIACTLSLCEEPPDLASASAMALFRVVQARFGLLERQAVATRVDLVLGLDAGAVTLVIEDDGHAVDPDDPDPLARLALQALVLRFGGQLEVVPLDPGCRLEASVPLV